MRAHHLALLSALFLSHVPGWSGAAAPTSMAASAAQQRVDALFARWNRTDTPGAAVEVVKDGKVAYRRGFGMADIEHGAPIMPSTAFHVASLSKQFTAFAVLLLAQDGKLSLDDDVRTYLPEVPDFGHTITIRHLMSHTSGLRDQWDLLGLAGWRMEDVITDEDVLRLVLRQRHLNFVPGSEYAYCNTGFTLLALLVQRVAGKPLAAFAQERIFAPLGMKHTFFHEQYGTLVQGRAESYQPAPDGGYEGVPLSYSTVGPTSLFSSADDLALWGRNFDAMNVGGKELFARMLQPAVLNDGEVIDYGAGVGVGKYRGLPKISHSGADAGYRSYLLHFPQQQLTVVVVANSADVPAARLGQRIADIFLDGQLEPAAPPVPDYTGLAQVALDPARLDGLVGVYTLGPDSTITFSKENGHLVGWGTGDDKKTFFPSGEREFFAKVENASFTFDPPGADGVAAGGTLHSGASAIRATRIAKGEDSQLRAFEGEFYSDELHVLYTMRAQGGKLVMSYPRGDITLGQVGKASFVGPWPFGNIEFQCAAGGACTGFRIGGERVRNLQFAKVAVVGAGPNGSTGVILGLPPQGSGQQ